MLDVDEEEFSKTENEMGKDGGLFLELVSFLVMYLE